MDYKKVLRLHYISHLSGREIAEICGCSKTTVNEFLKRFKEHPGLKYPLSEDITNEYLAQELYKKPGSAGQDGFYRMFDPEAVSRALTKKGETRKHLWQKYLAEGSSDGKKALSYRQFCRKYEEWSNSQKITFHIQRQPGVNLELDFAGKTLLVHNRVNPDTTSKVTIFIAALSYSGYFYAEGLTSCDIKNWIRVNNNALDYFGGVPQTVTPDNCKVAVLSNKDWINPRLNKDFQAWAEYNQTYITPAKVKSPRWKPVVENHVKLVTMHILLEMEEMVFYSLEELNKELWRRVREVNQSSFSGLSYSRFDLFTKEEKETLLPLPQGRFEYLERKIVKVAQDFSFSFDKVHYSMPRKYLRKQLEVRASDEFIYVYNMHGDLIRTHKRSHTPKDWVVIPSDMPTEYADYGYWNVPYFLHKADAIGPSTRAVIERVIQKFTFPVQSFRSCFGILNYAKRYSANTLERCCEAALLAGRCNYTFITNTISSYVEVENEDNKNLESKKEDSEIAVTGAYKDNDEEYSMAKLLQKQEASRYDF